MQRRYERIDGTLFIGADDEVELHGLVLNVEVQGTVKIFGTGRGAVRITDGGYAEIHGRVHVLFNDGHAQLAAGAMVTTLHEGPDATTEIDAEAVVRHRSGLLRMTSS